MTPRKDTVALLKFLYQLAHMQAGLAREDMSMVVDWTELRRRLEHVLVGEGIELPELPEIPERPPDAPKQDV
jgi:hypothetical protein